MTDDPFDEAKPASRGLWYGFGPIFTATYESDCPSCDDPIEPGEDIRADGWGDFIHADTQCERVARRD